jgi:hypothetical protein
MDSIRLAIYHGIIPEFNNLDYLQHWHTYPLQALVTYGLANMKNLNSAVNLIFSRVGLHYTLIPHQKCCLFQAPD